MRLGYVLFFLEGPKKKEKKSQTNIGKAAVDSANLRDQRRKSPSDTVPVALPGQHHTHICCVIIYGGILEHGRGGDRFMKNPVDGVCVTRLVVPKSDPTVS